MGAVVKQINNCKIVARNVNNKKAKYNVLSPNGVLAENVDMKKAVAICESHTEFLAPKKQNRVFEGLNAYNFISGCRPYTPLVVSISKGKKQQIIYMGINQKPNMNGTNTNSIGYCTLQGYTEMLLQAVMNNVVVYPDEYNETEAKQIMAKIQQARQK